MADRLYPGQIFANRYRVERFIAKGGFGVVYSAEHIETEARVALKVIWSHVIESDAALEQFKLEARLASRVGSEHVARVFDVGRDSETERPFLAMELLEGQHFEELVRAEGHIAAATLVEYFRQIGYALDRAHGYTDKEGVHRPIVHRDLKPENLFLTRRADGEPLVKILDFGLAKMVSDSASLSRDLKGTPLFMAFEQASVGPVTPQTDIWALGLIAFYLLTGRCYWLAANAPESPFTRLFTEVLSAPLEPPSVRARLLSAPVIPTTAFDQWFARCVIRDHTKRFQTAGECVAELAAALRGSPDAPNASGGVRPAGSGETLPSVVPEAMPTVRSLTPSSVGLLPSKPESSHARRVYVARRAVWAVIGVMSALVAFAAVTALRRTFRTVPEASVPAPNAVAVLGADPPNPGIAGAAPRVQPASLGALATRTKTDAGPSPASVPKAAKAHPSHAHFARPDPAPSTGTPPEDPYDHR